MEWWNDFNGAFWISIATLTMGALGLCFKSCLSSKCSHTEICYGCLKIERDTRAEEDIELATINHIPPPTPPSIGDNMV